MQNKRLMIERELALTCLIMIIAGCSREKSPVRHEKPEMVETAHVMTESRIAPESKNSNLAENSGFEESCPYTLQPSYWQFADWNSPGASGETDESKSRSGEKSLLIHKPDKRGTVLYTQVVPVKPDTEYVLSGWMKNTEYDIGYGSMGSAIFACSSDLKKEFVRMPRRAPQGSKWTRVQKAFRTDKDTNEARIGVKVGGVSGNTWFDDIAIIELEQNSKQGSAK